MDGYFYDYLDRFPSGFRDFIRVDKNKKAFLASIRSEYEPVKVFRFVHCRMAVFERDFLNNIDESKIFTPDRIVKNVLDNHGVSVNESLEMMKKCLKFPNKRLHYQGIAVGEMNCKYGPASFDEDHTHHNWYLYDQTACLVANNFRIYVEE